MPAVREQSTSVALQFVHIPEWGEAIDIALSVCDRKLYDWLMQISPSLLNETQQSYLDNFDDRIQEVITRRLIPPVPAPESESTTHSLTVQVNTTGVAGGGVSRSGTGTSVLSKKYEFSIQFSGDAIHTDTPDCSSVLDADYYLNPAPLLFYRLVGYGTNNKACEGRLSGTLKESVVGATFTTGDALARALLDGNITWSTSRIVEYSLQFGRITTPPIPDELFNRMPPVVWSQSAVGIDTTPYGGGTNDVTSPDGWIGYVEIIEASDPLWPKVWWACVGFTNGALLDGTSSSKGAINFTVNPYDLFKNHPGDPMAMLDDYITSEGSEGSWSGRFFLHRHYVGARLADAYYEGSPLGTFVFPGAWINMVYYPYDPGYSAGADYCGGT